MADEFAEFEKIERLSQPVTVTEKIHGTNAQLFIGEDGGVRAGSRNRWLTTEDDNYGFAAWVESSAPALFAALGPGRHYGEWYGLGINSGYGLKEKRFALFNTFRWTPVQEAGGLPERVDVVPVLYKGPFDYAAIDTALQSLKTGGSVLAPGFAHPEGIVVRFDRTGVMMKHTFESEDVAWKGRRAERAPSPDRDAVAAMCAPYWQPMRLEKLLSRDERFAREYPTSLPQLCSAYAADLTTETEIPEDTLKLVKKNLFKAVKEMMAERGYTA